MKPIAEMWLVELDVTNACYLQCANCTRFVGHHKKPYFMKIDIFRRALDSLEGFPGKIGLMGGEPTMHPQFDKLCALLRERVASEKRVIFTSGYHWEEYEPILRETFNNNVFYNDHSGKGQKHQPVLLAIDEVLPDKAYMNELIDACWVQQRWSPSITPKGCFFCEVAVAMDMLFDGPGGWPIEQGWWHRMPHDYKEQIKRHCYRCSCALPLPPCSNKGKDLISQGNYELLKRLGSPRLAKDDSVQIVNRQYTRNEIERYAKNWEPWNYLGSNGKRSSRSLYGKISRHRTQPPSNFLQKILWCIKDKLP